MEYGGGWRSGMPMESGGGSGECKSEIEDMRNFSDVAVGLERIFVGIPN